MPKVKFNRAGTLGDLWFAQFDEKDVTNEQYELLRKKGWIFLDDADAVAESEILSQSALDRKIEQVLQVALDKRFDALEVGGRNYLLNTLDFSKNWRVYSQKSSVATQSIQNGIYECNHLTAGWSELAQDEVITLDKVPVGSSLMLSFEAKTDVGGDIRFVFREFYTSEKNWTYPVAKWVRINASDKWVRYEVELPKMATHSNEINPFKRINFLLTNWIVRNFSIRKLKLELGNIATDWTPAPEDFYNEINVVKSRLGRLSDLD